MRGADGGRGPRPQGLQGRVPVARLSAAGVPGASPLMSRQQDGVRTDFLQGESSAHSSQIEITLTTRITNSTSFS